MFGSKPIVGLDIGSDKVKVVQLKSKGGAHELERFAVADVFPDGNKTPGGDAREFKRQAVRRALADARVTAKHCITVVSGESVIVRYIQLPQMPEAELKNALRWEAEEYIPFHLDEVNLDSVVLGPSASPGKVDVLLVCAKKDMVSDHVSIVRDAGLTPLVVDVDTFAFLNCFDVGYKPAREECVALVNIGAGITNTAIHVGGTLRFSRDISVAGNAITQAIAQKTGLPWAKAEELKLAIGAPQPEGTEESVEEESSLISSIRGTVERMTGSDLGDDSHEGVAAKSIRNTLVGLVGELRRTLNFYEDNAGGTPIQRVVVGGGTSRMANLANFLSKELELPVETMDPTRGMNVGSGVDGALLNASREHLGVGIGLALRKAG